MSALKKRLATRLRGVAARLDPQPKATIYFGHYPPGVYGVNGVTRNVKINFTGGQR